MKNDDRTLEFHKVETARYEQEAVAHLKAALGALSRAEHHAASGGGMPPAHRYASAVVEVEGILLHLSAEIR
ncbi:MAG: hypothetical protein GEU99_16965 [Luteitalea sp.]|nr:hypothetical protein [Luteitalea sp.]